MYKIVVAGCGNMSNRWLDYVAQREDAEIVGLVDIRQEAAEAMAERRGLQAKAYTDVREAIRGTEANLVFDVTIPESHATVVTTALREGCNVFGEKPLAASLEEANRVLSVVQDTGLRYAVMQNRRYISQIRPFRSMVQSGAIGAVGTIYADFFLGPHFGGFRDVMDSPLLLDMAIHTFDQARFIGGADPVSVYCHEYNPPGSWYKGNASAVCIFEMSDGSVFCYRGSWCAVGMATSWHADWRVTGSRGTIRWDGADKLTGEAISEGAAEGASASLQPLQPPPPWTGREGHFGCLDEMFLSLQEGRPAETDSADNFKSLAMVFGAIESARTGCKVKIDG
ncbi:MAG: gfo/Idh/MocA family oxidoreductase [Paenibacillus sp.]|nr:gfo/Idh/MocA family oxidoreductase [Paenibacillus sp.]